MNFINKLNVFFKGFVLLLRPHVFLGWLRQPFLTTSNILALSKWVSAQDKKNMLNDYYSQKRDYTKRFQLYQYVIDQQNLQNEKFDYLEFGVCGGGSFQWWIANVKNTDDRFYGFDTFEGLPENWGTFAKGDMAAGIPVTDDTRVKFLKGLFQETLFPFIAEGHLRSDVKKIIHLDADLFSSTLFALTSLAPHLKKGDILLFDEFNVPNHEFYAFNIFCKSFYVKTKLIAAVNNYYQVAMVIE